MRNYNIVVPADPSIAAHERQCERIFAFFAFGITFFAGALVALGFVALIVAGK